MLSPLSKVHATQEKFCCVIFLFRSTCFDKLHILPPQKTFHFFHFYLSEKRLSVYLPQCPPTFSHSLLCSLVFALFCNVLHCTGRCFGCPRLDCYTDQQGASACFLLFDKSNTPPLTNNLRTRTQTSKQRCIKDRNTVFYCPTGREHLSSLRMCKG